MPAVNYSGGGRSPGRRGYKALPLWLQWVIPFAVAIAVFVALVLWVHYENHSVPQTALVSNPNALREEVREDRIIVQQQQAPHLAKLKAGQAPAAGLSAAVRSWMTRQISIGTMNGPIKRLACRPAVGSAGPRLVFSCTLTASAALTYPFDGVVDRSRGVITWCQRITPPVPSMNVPVSKRCT